MGFFGIKHIFLSAIFGLPERNYRFATGFLVFTVTDVSLV